MVFSGQAPLPIVGKAFSASKFKFVDVDSLELARQITIMESKIFNRIQPIELLGKAWSYPETKEISQNVRLLIERANKVTFSPLFLPLPLPLNVLA